MTRAGSLAIEIDGLSHTYARRGSVVEVLRDANLRVDRGAYVSLVGPSGTGKSTLLAVLGGLERPQHGSVIVCGTSLSGLSGNDLAHFRLNTVGFVFQHFGLLEALTASENVELALSLAGVRRDVRRQRAVDLLGSVGLTHRIDHRPLELSGGERQRVAIARAIANEPEILLADEPTGNLDVASAEVVVELLATLRAERSTTLVVVTHNPAIAKLAESHYRIENGALVADDAEQGDDTNGVA